MTPFCLAILALAPATDTRPASGAGYTKPELLLEPAELARPEIRKKYVVLDARARSAYTAGHVPGAAWVDAADWGKAFAKGQKADDWAKRIGALGIDVDTPVVVVGLGRTPEAARVWWVLRYWGVKDVRLLNGGHPGYTAAGGAVEKTAAPAPAAKSPKLQAQPERLAVMGEMVKGLKEKKYHQIIDARTVGEHCGETKSAKRAGSIPQAKHLEWVDLIEAKSGRFKSNAEISKLFAAAGIDPKQPATTYCQSGGRASVMAFAYELVTGKPARNYYRSWSEWGNDPTTPVEVPKKKK